MGTNPSENDSRPRITRRTLLKAAFGISALAAVGGATSLGKMDVEYVQRRQAGAGPDPEMTDRGMVVRGRYRPPELTREREKQRYISFGVATAGLVVAALSGTELLDSNNQ